MPPPVRQFSTVSRKYRIGTSGWHYTHWRGRFYPSALPSSEWLEYYASQFDTVEINNSFYRLPGLPTVRDWCQRVPARFLFSVKASRYITHIKRLRAPRRSSARFLRMLDGFGSHLGPVLFQLPPRWRCDAERLRKFLKGLPDGHRYVVELRDQSWYHDVVYELLQRHNVALCHADLGGQAMPWAKTADFSYWRLHGPTQAYRGRYGTRRLRPWAQRIETTPGRRQVYVYFDNDQAAYATTDAITLRHLLTPSP